MTFNQIETGFGLRLPTAYKAYVNRLRSHYGVVSNTVIYSDLDRLFHINKTLIDESRRLLSGSKRQPEVVHPFVTGFQANVCFVIGAAEDIFYYLECVDCSQMVYQYQLSTRSILRVFSDFDEFANFAEEVAAGIEGRGFLA